MAARHIHSIAFAALSAASTIGAAHAGGLEANGYNWDLLFDPGTYVGKGTVTHVIINHDIRNAAGTTVSTSSNRNYYNFAAKADLIDNASCLVSVQNPWGSGTDRSIAYAANPANPQSARERITSNDIGLTCAYGFSVGPGLLSVIGGISAQQLDYQANIPLSLTTTGPVSLNGSAVGWRAGLAYEVTDIALRVSAIYNAAIDYNLSGTANLGATLPATASVTTPQTFEVKAQTGIAPGWLLLGGVKWIDWSVLDSLTVVTPGPDLTTRLEYEDGWTITAGVGHQLTEELTVLGSLTWDKGTSRENAAGVLTRGTQTDRWGASLGAAYKPSANFELSGGVSYSVIGGGSNLQNERWDAGNVLAFSLSAKATF
jgi:long-chain fatty acid transport protein